MRVQRLHRRNWRTSACSWAVQRHARWGHATLAINRQLAFPGAGLNRFIIVFICRRRPDP